MKNIFTLFMKKITNKINKNTIIKFIIIRIERCKKKKKAPAHAYIYILSKIIIYIHIV
jgi:hypothetical protein